MQGQIEHLSLHQATTENKEICAYMLCKALHKLLLFDTTGVVLLKPMQNIPAVSRYTQSRESVLYKQSLKVKSVMLWNGWCNTPQSTSGQPWEWTVWVWPLIWGLLGWFSVHPADQEHLPGWAHGMGQDVVMLAVFLPLLKETNHKITQCANNLLELGPSHEM